MELSFPPSLFSIKQCSQCWCSCVETLVILWAKFHVVSSLVTPETHRATHRPSEAFGEAQEQHSCSAALEAFGTTRMLSALIQHAKSEKVDCRPSEPLDCLTGCVLANQRGVWEERNTVHFVFLCTLFRYFLFSCFGVLEYNAYRCEGG